MRQIIVLVLCLLSLASCSNQGWVAKAQRSDFSQRKYTKGRIVNRSASKKHKAERIGVSVPSESGAQREEDLLSEDKRDLGKKPIETKSQLPKEEKPVKIGGSKMVTPTVGTIPIGPNYEPLEIYSPLISKVLSLKKKEDRSKVHPGILIGFLLLSGGLFLFLSGFIGWGIFLLLASFSTLIFVSKAIRKNPKKYKGERFSEILTATILALLIIATLIALLFLIIVLSLQ